MKLNCMSLIVTVTSGCTSMFSSASPRSRSPTGIAHLDIVSRDLRVHLRMRVTMTSNASASTSPLPPGKD
jgi:uncharacterized protein YceK